ncbi:MAG: type II secretion system F family protein [Planctomycetota bacterium]
MSPVPKTAARLLVPRWLRFFVPKWLAGDSLRSQQKSLLRLLAISHAEGIDPRTLIGNLATEQAGPYRRTLIRLKGWLSAGSSISAALGRTPGALSEDETLAIQCAIENDRVDDTFRMLMQRAEEEPPTQPPVFSSTMIYVVVCSIFLLWVVGLMTFIIPTFQEMFEEFDVELPAAMIALIRFTSRFGGFSLLVVFAVLLLGVAFQFSEIRRLIYLGFWRHVSPNTPSVRRAAILRLLAVPTRTGEPIAATLTAAAQFHPESHVRTQLMEARGLADDDPTLLGILANQGLLLRREAIELPKIETPTLRAWAMLTLAEQKAQRVAQRTRVATNFVRHLPVLVLAVLVGWIAVAFIQSLTALIQPLA